MNITIEKAEKNSLTFAYIWRGEPNQSPPVKEFHTSIDGEAGKAIVEQKAKDWLAAQHGAEPTGEDVAARYTGSWVNDVYWGTD